MARAPSRFPHPIAAMRIARSAGSRDHIARFRVLSKHCLELAAIIIVQQFQDTAGKRRGFNEDHARRICVDGACASLAHPLVGAGCAVADTRGYSLPVRVRRFRPASWRGLRLRRVEQMHAARRGGARIRESRHPARHARIALVLDEAGDHPCMACFRIVMGPGMA